jgi:hypothetical protein
VIGWPAWISLHGFASLGLALLLAAPTAQSQLDKLRARYEKETDPVRRGKLMPKLGAAEFDEIRRAARAHDFARALEVFGQYRDQAEEAHKALDARGVDPEKKPGGYKELQISLREALRQSNEIFLLIPPNWHQGFNDVLLELDSLNRRLIFQLFPRQPGRRTKSVKPAT